MSRIITSISFNMSMIVSAGFPPPCAVSFTDRASDGHESPGRVVLTDADAASVWGSVDPITAVNKVLDAKAAALPDLPSIAARMTAVDDLDRQSREKKATADALDAQIEAKRAILTNTDAQIATKQIKLTAMAAPAAGAT